MRTSIQVSIHKPSIEEISKLQYCSVDIIVLMDDQRENFATVGDRRADDGDDNDVEW